MPAPAKRQFSPIPVEQVTALPRRHDNNNPLWLGPCASGPMGGITQSMLVRFLSCRERFRLKYILGLEPHDKWNKNTGYGNMWHVCEESLAGDDTWCVTNLDDHTKEQLRKYPFQMEEIEKWYNVCLVQFPEYVKHWVNHPDVQNRVPLAQEKVFDIPYTLPSGRVVRLRGKFDSVDLIDNGVWLQENKTRGDVDREQVERQLRFDLQTMLYLVALQEQPECDPTEYPIMGVRYNVVRRPLSGGVGNIKPHAAKYLKTKTVPAETMEEFYERLRKDYFEADPDHWFFRVRLEVGQRDIDTFRDTCLDPMLEHLCWWYDSLTLFHGRRHQPVCPVYAMNYRTPFGVWSALEENGSTEYDSYLEGGSEAGLRRVETLFTELQ